MKNILAADDSPIQRTLVERRLVQMGFEVVTAADGNEALDQVRTLRPDAVISDITMPGLELRAVQGHSAGTRTFRNPHSPGIR